MTLREVPRRGTPAWRRPDAELLLGFRFGVFFFIGGADPDALDIRFQKVSGLSAEVTLTDHPEGGENLYTHRLPDRVSHPNLVLERGLVVGSPLSGEFEAAMSSFEFRPSNVILSLFDGEGEPVAAWRFEHAFPVRWAVSDLDAASVGVAVETLELAYTRRVRLET